MLSRPFCPSVSLVLCCGLICSPAFSAQDPGQSNSASQKYKLTVLEGAATSKRVKKGRVSSQAVVKVTDTNNVPVPGVAVTFSLPMTGGSGASFAGGTFTSVVTTNAAGVASSGTISAAAGSSFSVGVSAAVPGGMLSASVPVSSAAAGAAAGAGAGAAGAAGLSTGAIAGIAAAAATIIGVVAAKVASGGGNKTVTGTIGAAGAPAFGHP